MVLHRNTLLNPGLWVLASCIKDLWSNFSLFHVLAPFWWTIQCYSCISWSLRKCRLQKRKIELSKIKLQGDLTAAFQFLNGVYEKDMDRPFSRASAIGFKLKEDQFRLRIKKKFFTTRMVEHWNNLPKEVMDASFLETFKVKLGKALTNLI